MKTKLLAIALLLPSVAAFSASNTVTFFGEVSDATCNVTLVNGQSGDVSVQLNTANIANLATEGAFAGETEFDFVASGCTAVEDGQSNVGIRLVPQSATNAGNLPNIATTNPADNVEIQLLDKGNGGGVINFASGEYTSITQAIPPAADGSVTIPFAARYYSTGTATAGKVEGKVQYELAYN